MPSSIDRTGGEIDWPDWAPRTSPEDRKPTSKFKVTPGTALSELETELEDRLDALDYRISTAAPHRKEDGRPYADSNPDDPGVVVRWTMRDPDSDGTADFEVVADKWTDLRDNVRELGLWVKEKRKMEARNVKTMRSEFASARKALPGDNGDVIAAKPAEPDLSDEEAAELLGLASPDVSDRVVEVSYQEAVKSEHPDQGGRGDVDRLQAARDQLLSDT